MIACTAPTFSTGLLCLVIGALIAAVIIIRYP